MGAALGLGNMKNKRRRKKQIGVIVGSTLMGLASVQARAEATNSPSVSAEVEVAGPERPSRPVKPGSVNVSELKQILKNFQEQKKEFLKNQQQARDDQRAGAREQLNSTVSSVAAAVVQAKDSVVEAKRNAREQARKLADEAKEAANDNRLRD
jgi:hypothetical protein